MIKFLQFVVEILFTIMSVIAMFMLFMLLYPIAAVRYKMMNLITKKNNE